MAFRSKTRILVASVSVIAIIFLSSSTAVSLPHVFATITNAQFSPSDNVVGAYTFYTVKFVLGTTATISNIVLTWPAGYNVATEKFVFNNGVPFGTTTATNGPPVTITYCFGSTACTSGGGTPTSESSGDVVTFMFANIQNPTTAGSYTPPSICTYDLTTKVECQTSITAITIGDITSGDLASSISITALTTGTLSDTGTLSVTGAATFASSLTATGLLSANGGIDTSAITGSSGFTLNTGTGGLDVVASSGEELEFQNNGNLCAGARSNPCEYNDFEPSGTICNGVGSTPCGGVFELDAPSGNVIAQGNVTAENFLTDGQLYVASGTFHVDSSGNVLASSVTLSGTLSASTLSAAGGKFEVGATGDVTTSGNVTAENFMTSGQLSVASGTFHVDSSGNLITQGNVTAENFITAGQLYVASGTFHVSSSGQITTPSVGFNSFGANAIPAYDQYCGAGGTCTTPSFTPSENAVAYVYVTIVYSDTTPGYSAFNLDLETTYSGATIVDSSYPVTYCPSCSAVPPYPENYNTATFLYVVYNIAAGSSGTFEAYYSLLSGGESPDFVNWQVSYIMLPAI